MIIVKLSLLVLISIIIQSTILSSLYMPGLLVTPDLVLVIVVCLALLRGSDEGLIIGLCAGLLLDLKDGNIIGIQALSKMLLGFSVGTIQKKFFKDNYLIVIAVVFIATVFFDGFNLFLYSSFGANYNFTQAFLNIIIPTAIFNLLVTPFFYYFLLNSEKKMNLNGEYKN